MARVEFEFDWSFLFCCCPLELTLTSESGPPRAHLPKPLVASPATARQSEVHVCVFRREPQGEPQPLSEGFFSRPPQREQAVLSCWKVCDRAVKKKVVFSTTRSRELKE